jgi:hypothetical protein
VWAMVGLLVVFIVAIVGLGLFYPGSGAEQVDWKPTRSPQTEAELEVEDIDQMIEAQNERRRRRGQAELTEDDVRLRVAADERERRRRQGEYRAREGGARRRAPADPAPPGGPGPPARADGSGDEPGPGARRPPAA